MKPSATWKVSRGEHGMPLLDLLSGHLDVSRKQAKRLLDARSVFVNRQRIWMARHAVRAGDQIEVVGLDHHRGTARTPPVVTIPVLREEPGWLVVNKPAGLVTNGTDSVEAALRIQRQEPLLEAVHRLDRDTTGCLLFARTSAARAYLVSQFEAQAVRKIYLALVHGRFPADLHRMSQPLEGLEAVTEFRLWQATPRASLIEARPLTGRTHQIRLHARATGHPLAGDRAYTTGVVEDTLLRQLPRQMLHAWKLAWPDEAGNRIELEAPWPDDFRRAVTRLGLNTRGA